MKAFLAMLAVALAVPVSAVAHSDVPAPRGTPVTAHLHPTARGTDVAAADQQVPIPPTTAPHARATSNFDTGAAAIGAGGALVLVAMALGGVLMLRRSFPATARQGA